MNCRHVKVAILIAVFLLFVSSILVSGCAMNDKCSTVPSEKFFVMDLSDKPEYQPLLEGKPQTRGMRSGRVYLKSGESCGQHSTENHEELLIFLSGKGVAFIGEEETPYEVSQGKICYIPPYTLHNNKNTGTKPLIYIYCVTPVK